VPEQVVKEKKLAGPEMAGIVGVGVTKAVSGLSQMAGVAIEVTSVKYTKVKVQEVPDLFGGPGSLIVGVYLGISGTSNGHMIVAYQPNVAFELIELLIGQAPTAIDALNEMERSVMGEIGNVMGSFFLNHLSDTMGVSLQPSPPAVMVDMAGAILDVALANVLQYSDYTYVIDTTFGTKDHQISGTFLVVPDAESSIA